MRCHLASFRLFFFFFNYTATSEIYTLSLHDALPSSPCCCAGRSPSAWWWACCSRSRSARSEEHTSELQSHVNLVCRLLLEKKNIARCHDLPAHRLRPRVVRSDRVYDLKRQLLHDQRS